MTKRRDPATLHNETARRMLHELITICEGDRARLNVLAETLLLGVGMFNFPQDPRRQALIVQEIADGAADRARTVSGNTPRT